MSAELQTLLLGAEVEVLAGPGDSAAGFGQVVNVWLCDVASASDDPGAAPSSLLLPAYSVMFDDGSVLAFVMSDRLRIVAKRSGPVLRRVDADRDGTA